MNPVIRPNCIIGLSLISLFSLMLREVFPLGYPDIIISSYKLETLGFFISRNGTTFEYSFGIAIPISIFSGAVTVFSFVSEILITSKGKTLKSNALALGFTWNAATVVLIFLLINS